MVKSLLDGAAQAQAEALKRNVQEFSLALVEGCWQLYRTLGELIVEWVSHLAKLHQSAKGRAPIHLHTHTHREVYKDIYV